MLKQNNKYSENDKWPQDKTGGHTQVNEHAQNMQSAVAGRPKSAGLMDGTDGWCPDMPGTLAYTNQHTRVTSQLSTKQL